jgi:GAF domain-containing protein
LPAFTKEQVCSALVVPIILERETLGLIEMGSRKPWTFRPQDVRLLNAIGNQVGLAIQKARLIHETERRANEQAALNIIAKAISQSLRIAEDCVRKDLRSHRTRAPINKAQGVRF